MHMHKDGWPGEKVDFHISALVEKKDKTKEKPYLTAGLLLGVEADIR
jgi:hypothetical protein